MGRRASGASLSCGRAAVAKCSNCDMKICAEKDKGRDCRCCDCFQMGRSDEEADDHDEFGEDNPWRAFF